MQKPKRQKSKSEGRGAKFEVRSRKGEMGPRKAEGKGPAASARPVSAARPLASVTISPLLVVISAPSGGGKTTLRNELLRVRKDMVPAITCTTREPRPGERDGVDYYFLEAGAFLKRVQAGNFLEHATVYGHSYGTLKSEVLGKLRQGRDVLLNVDVQGAATIRQRAEEDPELKRAVVSIFLTPPSLAVLEQRLRKRGTDSEAVIQKRLSVARQEIAQWKNFDYLLISDTVEEDVRRALAIIEAEKMQAERAMPPQF